MILALPTATKTKRSDARRNREAVVDAAITLLGRRPDATMAEIAAASGVGRTTVYRHFPNREDLIVVLFERVIEESRQVTLKATSRDATAAEILRELGHGFVELGLRFRFLHSYRNVGHRTLQEGKHVESDPVRVYFAAASRRGEIRDLPLQWCMSAIQALSLAAMDDLLAGFTDERTAGKLLGETFVAAFVAP